MKYYVLIITAFIVLNPFMLNSNSVAAETVPDDIRYMLEDLYGADKAQWPSPIYRDDLNNDGYTDWVAQQRGCKSDKACPVELFVCKPDGSGRCTEYCYFQLETIKQTDNALASGKCESAC